MRTRHSARSLLLDLLTVAVERSRQGATSPATPSSPVFGWFARRRRQRTRGAIHDRLPAELVALWHGSGGGRRHR